MTAQIVTHIGRGPMTSQAVREASRDGLAVLNLLRRQAGMDPAGQLWERIAESRTPNESVVTQPQWERMNVARNHLGTRNALPWEDPRGPKLTQLGFTDHTFAAIVRNGEHISVGSIL